MSARRRAWAGAIWVVAAACAFGGALAAWSGGGAAPAPEVAAPDVAEGRAPAIDEREVFLRLVEVASEATFDVPRGDTARALVAAHGGHRPFFLGDRASPFVTRLALRASAGEGSSDAWGEGHEGWTPDARRHRADVGSSHEREALVSAAPGTITFSLDVPRGAELVFAKGTLPATREATLFVVSVVDANGETHELYREALEPGGGWREASCDLGAFAGQRVELRLSTEAAGARGAPVALWGNPTVLTSGAAQLAHNLLWIVVDGLRADAVTSLRGGDVGEAAPAALREVSATPSIDAWAARGARFASAYSASPSTRPAMLAMLAGARSTELGLDAASTAFERQHVQRFYASEPPLLPLSLRRHGAATAAFLAGDARSGHGAFGVEMGFERVEGHDYRTRDTLEITRSAASWIEAHKATRFFAFVRYASPMSPYEPPDDAARIAKSGPDPARQYMGEVAKDDAAVGVLLRALEAAGVSERTVVVITSGHGEPMAPARTSKLIGSTRGDPAASNYEEAVRVPLVVVAPGLIPEGARVGARVRTIDLAPTILELLGVEGHPRMSGRSLVALANGAEEPADRVVVTEARGTRAIRHDRFRLIARSSADDAAASRRPPVELYDLAADPGERRDVSAEEPDVAVELLARLRAALEGAPVPGARHAGSADAEPSSVLRLRFAGGPEPRRVVGTITIGDEHTAPRRLRAIPIELEREALRVEGRRIEIAFRTSPSAPVGFDLVLEPSALPVTWELWVDDRPWPEHSVFGGPFGLPAPALWRGVATDEARRAARAELLPHVDPAREVGLFVTRLRARPATDEPAEGALEERGAVEAVELLRAWRDGRRPL